MISTIRYKNERRERDFVVTAKVRPSGGMDRVRRRWRGVRTLCGLNASVRGRIRE